MSPDDPRHGTYAGYQAHTKIPEPPCEPCRIAQRKYFKRMKYRCRTKGPERTVLGQQAWEVIDSRSREQLARATGLRPSFLSRLHTGGPEHKVYQRTRDKILSAPQLVGPIGIQRRLRALFALGYSGSRLASWCHMSDDAMRTLLRSPEPSKFHHDRTITAVTKVYDELALAPMPTGRVAVATRNRAVTRGWAPPLAWNDIDDPNETPTGHRVCSEPDCAGEIAAKGKCITHYKHSYRSPAMDDRVLVDRILSGQWRTPCGPIVKAEVCRVWVARGGSLAELERRTGWNTPRYWKVGGAA